MFICFIFLSFGVKLASYSGLASVEIGAFISFLQTFNRLKSSLAFAE